jgi:large repetitive protein
VLPDAEVGVAYSAPLVSGGHPPYTVNNVKGVFPQGLSDTLASGALSGTPASSRSKSFTIQITDDLGSSVTGTFTVKIFRALENTTRALKTGINGRPYKATLKAAGGKKPYNWFLVSGNLPAGLTLNSLTGAIAGIPVESGTFDLTFHVTDPVGGIAETALTLTIK